MTLWNREIKARWQKIKIIDGFLWLLELFLPFLFILTFAYLLVRLYYVIVATLQFRPIAELNENVLFGLIPWITNELIPAMAGSNELRFLATVFIAAIGLYFLIRRTKTAEQNLEIAI